jgi:hypothetical protein
MVRIAGYGRSLLFIIGNDKVVAHGENRVTGGFLAQSFRSTDRARQAPY